MYYDYGCIYALFYHCAVVATCTVLPFLLSQMLDKSYFYLFFKDLCKASCVVLGGILT